MTRLAAPRTRILGLDMTRLFHVSEEGQIGLFRPRPVPDAAKDAAELAVWAIDQEHLPNYLLPRDCPRVTFRAAPTSSADDVERFFDHTQTRRMIVVEQGWLNRILTTSLHVYEMPVSPFRLVDVSAGYYIAQEPVIPLSVREVKNSLPEIAGNGYELRLVPNLWPIHDGIMRSTLDYSIIRMRNALPRA
jgi:hypothetical protein